MTNAAVARIAAESLMRARLSSDEARLQQIAVLPEVE